MLRPPCSLTPILHFGPAWRVRSGSWPKLRAGLVLSRAEQATANSTSRSTEKWEAAPHDWGSTKMVKSRCGKRWRSWAAAPVQTWAWKVVRRQEKCGKQARIAFAPTLARTTCFKITFKQRAEGSRGRGQKDDGRGVPCLNAAIPRQHTASPHPHSLSTPS